ncbi:MAG: type II secretion system protein GspN [Oligoflexia bacterium]|nr:type II secretion system protein GspN [Oligoflexia bacterium]
MDSTPETTDPSLTALESAAPSRLRRLLKTAGWTLFALFCLVSFTILKLPEDRIRNFVHGTISNVLADYGIGFSASEGHISIGLGLSYVMKDVKLTPPPPAMPARLKSVTFSPSFLPLLTGRLGGTLRIDQDKGSLKADVTAKKQEFSVSLDARSFDSGAAGILPLTAELNGSFLLSGTGELRGDPNIPSTLQGQVALDLSRIVIDAQTIAGFSVPRLAISEGRLDAEIDRGKAKIKTLRLGKKGNPSEDFQGSVTGEMTLGRSWPSSTLNLKADFALSQTILKSFSLLEALLGMAKRPDGSYAYSIAGPLTAPIPTPAGQPPAPGGGPPSP